MKISVSLPEDDVFFVDEYGEKNEVTSRSAVIHAAIQMLRDAELEAEYEAAFAEWDTSEDADFWEQFSADGLTDEAR